MQKNSIPFVNHLQLAHHLWKSVLVPRISWALDATCGNGYDSAFLAKYTKRLYCMDIQPKAIEAARQMAPDAIFQLGCHSTLPEEAFLGPLRVICYNLGYLPGADKSLTTRAETTSLSIAQALERMPVGCIVSITFYPGHNEGLKELQAILPQIEKLDSNSFCVSHHGWINRKRAPSLVIILKLK